MLFYLSLLDTEEEKSRFEQGQGRRKSMAFQ